MVIQKRRRRVRGVSEQPLQGQQQRRRWGHGGRSIMQTSEYHIREPLLRMWERNK